MDPSGLDDSFEEQWFGENVLPENLPVLNNDPFLALQDDEIRQNFYEGNIQVGGGNEPDAEVENNIEENVVDNINEAVNMDQGEQPRALIQLNYGRQRLPRFLMDNFDMEFRIADPPAGQNPITWTMKAFRELYDCIIGVGRYGHNRFTMSFSFEGIENMPAYQRLRQIDGYTFEDLWNLVSQISQSAGGFNVTNTFRIKLYIIDGLGGRMWTPAVDLIRPKGVMKLCNTDEYCLPRALVTAIAGQKKLLKKASTGPLLEDWEIIRDYRRQQQKSRAIELSNLAGVAVPKEGCGLEEIKSFQNYLRYQGMAIIVYSVEKDNSAKRYPILFNGTEQVVEVYGSVGVTLRILYYPQVKHFEYIYAVKGLQSARHYCEPCLVKYKNQYSHKNCPYSCTKCYARGVCDTTLRKITCGKCNRFFYGQRCYDNHLIIGSYEGKDQTVCDNEQFCLTCHKIIFPKKILHSCGKFLCSTCKELCDEGHFCFMTPVKIPPATKQCVKFVFYDLETRQDDKFHGSEKMNIHVPNLCVAQQVCNVCCDTDDFELGKERPLCDQCGVCETIFHGEDCVNKFVDYVLEISKPKSCKKVICIAHNAKGFDAQFILTELFNRQIRDIDTIMTGTSVTLIELNNKKIKFIDSLNFISAPLSALPKSFGFEDKLQKGYFPHFFNTSENQDYIGVMPDKKFYGFNTMSEKTTPPKKSEKEEFLAWYEKRVNTNNNFNFKEEILHYCKLDVSILRIACCKFRKLILECGNVCPFTECTTIASTCMLFYRRNYLKEKQIGILPRSGYRLADNQSRVAIEWLTWLEHKQNIKITHALRGREVVTPSGVKLDGYREDKNGQKFAYQFHGCFWHGCIKCFQSDRNQSVFKNKNVKHISHNIRYENTQTQSRKIESDNYNLTEIWECEFNKEKKNNIELQAFLSSSRAICIYPLNPRDAFFGGRTGNAKTYHDIVGNEKIKYVDVCSLYPWVLKRGYFPIGHPTVYVGDECRNICKNNNNISTIEGLIKCRVLPPRNLFHPVLPYRAHGKLFFPLCKSCCDNLVQEECYHECESERELYGTWVSCELRKAVEKGYIIQEIDEIWSYDTVQYTPGDENNKGLFVEYINTFLKIKQEASGWPSHCVDSKSRQEYIETYEAREGIKLDSEKIEKNPGLRSLAKLFLNSFWGKFGQRENMTKKTIVKDYNELADLAFNPEVQITSLLPVNDETVFVSWQSNSECYTPSDRANVVIAAFTTAQARLKLYSYLDKLQEKVLYYDTDSVIYVSNGNNDLPIGDFLGDLTDELETYGKGSYITSFVSGGPKFYSYIVKNGDKTIECCKLKGVKINGATENFINYSTVRSLVVNNSDSFDVEYSGIRRDQYHQVLTKKEKKNIRVTGPKRRREGEADTFPYGYKKIRIK
ncbi:uncharacterized protein LOC123270042 [Cotesia glomerata]|uniref:uncharacterized protein LOC123270042 n=1 Tax=Cotesia glomerata TaxID=32391 RepID=UPI001D007A3C|nr:uncharacterized protein LOC123270042 [Cotesia glomerata]